MPVLPFLIFALCIFVIAYRYYSAWIAARLLSLDGSRRTPAVIHNDGQNYHPTHRWVLFGHHFAAISGAGPLIGPVLAAQFGFLPGFLWLVIGVVLGGAVHDMVLLTASVRHDGQSLAEIARRVLDPVAGLITRVAILFIIVIALAGLGLAVVNALSESAWGAFTIAASVPLALVMGIAIYPIGGGSDRAISWASLVGVLLMLLAVGSGKWVAESDWGQRWFVLSRDQITVSIALYGLVASVLPVWLLLCPRDYLSSYMKLGTIGILVVAVFWVQPDLRMPAWTLYTGGGGPILSGKVFPFVFITIACGAISGFHGLIATGTTPKMIKSENDIRPIGYLAMLFEGLVGVIALIAAASLHPEDYFAINTTVQKFASLGMQTVALPEIEAAVGERIAGRPGGAVSLAVGIAQIMSAVPWLAGVRGLLSYWYHFAIMFEALFILTTIDTGTRVARFLVQESIAQWFPRSSLARKESWVGSFVASALVVSAWAYLIRTGSIATLWPMFGISNQLLAMIGLTVGCVFVMKTRGSRAKRGALWVLLGPLLFLSITTLSAGFLTLRDQFLPQGLWLNSTLTALMMAMAVVVVARGLRLVFRSEDLS